MVFVDTSGAPRAVINSKGRRRRPGTKTLSQVLRCNDEEFVDFISKCLVWDPERRIKPQAAMRHPFVTAGRRLKPPPSAGKASSSSLTGNRSKQMAETPKKSLIGAPTPLTARSSRTATNGGPTTPSNSHASTMGSSRSYRTSQAHLGLGSLSSSRTLNGFAVSDYTSGQERKKGLIFFLHRSQVQPSDRHASRLPHYIVVQTCLSILNPELDHELT